MCQGGGQKQRIIFNYVEKILRDIYCFAAKASVKNLQMVFVFKGKEKWNTAARNNSHNINALTDKICQSRRTADFDNPQGRFDISAFAIAVIQIILVVGKLHLGKLSIQPHSFRLFYIIINIIMRDTAPLSDIY